MGKQVILVKISEINYLRTDVICYASTPGKRLKVSEKNKV